VEKTSKTADQTTRRKFLEERILHGRSLKDLYSNTDSDSFHVFQFVGLSVT
jgi:hypothetical protein